MDITVSETVCDDNKLILMHGLPRSGKSTWALAQDYPVVCPDAIRLCTTGKRWWGPIEYHVWATAKTMVRSLFLAGHKIVILDSTSRTLSAREMWKPELDVTWKLYYKPIKMFAHECIRRAIVTKMPELVTVIRSMVNNWEEIQPEEGIEEWPLLTTDSIICS